MVNNKQKIEEFINNELIQFKNIIAHAINPESRHYLFLVINPIIRIYDDGDINISLRLNIVDTLGNIYSVFRSDINMRHNKFETTLNDFISDFKILILKYLIHQNDTISVVENDHAVLGNINMKNAYKIAKILTHNANKQF